MDVQGYTGHGIERFSLEAVARQVETFISVLIRFEQGSSRLEVVHHDAFPLH